MTYLTKLHNSKVDYSVPTHEIDTDPRRNVVGVTTHDGYGDGSEGDGDGGHAAGGGADGGASITWKHMGDNPSDEENKSSGFDTPPVLTSSPRVSAPTSPYAFPASEGPPIPPISIAVPMSGTQPLSPVASVCGNLVLISVILNFSDTIYIRRSTLNEMPHS